MNKPLQFQWLPDPPQRTRVLNKRFQVHYEDRPGQSDLLYCYDLEAANKAVLIKLLGAENTNEHAILDALEIQTVAPEVALIFPRLIAKVDAALFAVVYPATHTTLEQNILLLRQMGQPANEIEAIRIGRALCAGSAAALQAGFEPILDTRTIFFATNGALQLVALRRGQTPVSSAAPDSRTIAALIGRLLNPAIRAGQIAGPDLAGIKDPGIRLLITQGLDGKIETIDQFARLLAGVGSASANKSFRRVNIVATLALAGVLLVGLFVHGKRIKEDQNQDSHETLSVREAALATVTQWRAFALDYSDIVPPQTAEAEQLFAKAEKAWANAEFRQAKPLYLQANTLYEQGLKVARAVEERRNLANGARLKALTVGSGWLRLVASPYVEVPDAVKQAQQAMATGDFRLLDHNYDDAQLAYDLAVDRFQSIPADQLKSLSQRHDVHINEDRARYAEKAWQQIAASTDSKLPESARQASSSMAQGQALLLAGDAGKAAIAFQQAQDLYNSATAALIQSMVAKQEITNARDRAVDAAQRWRSLAKLLNATEPGDISQADLLLQTADSNAAAGKQDQAKTQLNSAAEIYEREIADLQDRASGQYETDAAKARQLMDSIQNQKADLETNLLAARKRIETINLRLLAQNESVEHATILNDLANARKEFSIESRFSALCDVVVFAGAKLGQARDTLEHAQNLKLQGNLVAAAAASGPAVADLEALAKLPAQVREYFAARVEVEAAATSAQAKLGTIARQQTPIQDALTNIDQLMAQAEEQVKIANAVKAQEMLSDARLYIESLPGLAETELLRCATRADSELRNDTAIAALNELLQLNPANEQAKRLLQTAQSQNLPKDRIAIADGSWRINGKSLSNQPSIDDLERIVGQKARPVPTQSMFVFDDYGITAISSPENGKVTLITAYYGTPQYEYEPRKTYQGLVEIEGFLVKHDSSLDDLAHSLDRWKPQVSGKVIAVKMNNYHFQVAYGESTNAIYTVSIGFYE